MVAYTVPGTISVDFRARLATAELSGEDEAAWMKLYNFIDKVCVGMHVSLQCPYTIPARVSYPGIQHPGATHFWPASCS